MNKNGKSLFEQWNIDTEMKANKWTIWTSKCIFMRHEKTKNSQMKFSNWIILVFINFNAYDILIISNNVTRNAL